MVSRLIDTLPPPPKSVPELQIICKADLLCPTVCVLHKPNLFAHNKPLSIECADLIGQSPEIGSPCVVDQREGRTLVAPGNTVNDSPGFFLTL